MSSSNSVSTHTSINTNKCKFEKPELSVEELSKALYEVNLKLQAANDKLKQQEAERLAFYANISHDLRAPITALSNSIEYLLTDTSLTQEDFLSTLNIMQKRTDYMGHLINDIFLLSSLESSNDKVHMENVDIGFFLEDYFYMCEADSCYENVNLQLDMDENFSLFINIDPVLMHRILDNLFANALKYSNKSACITLSAYAKDKNLIIKVKDNGIGIAKEHLPHIFERSYMAQNSRTPNSTSSSGFGLAIAKSIVEHHNGTISCISTLGEGSTFEIRLPI